jgi:hypothetical protein
MVKFHKEVWPASIQGPKCDRFATKNGERVANIWTDQAGRSSGTNSSWRAVDIATGERIARTRTYAQLREEVIKFYSR